MVARTALKHPKYIDMICRAINSKQTPGKRYISAISIYSFIESTYDVPSNFKTYVRAALRRAVEDGLLDREKNSYKVLVSKKKKDTRSSTTSKKRTTRRKTKASKEKKTTTSTTARKSKVSKALKDLRAAKQTTNTLTSSSSPKSTSASTSTYTPIIYGGTSQTIPTTSANQEQLWDSGIHKLAGVVKPGSQVATVEVAFSFDATYSMNRYIDTVKDQLQQLLRQLLGDLPNLRISIIAHGDYKSYQNYVLKQLDLSNDIDHICDFVKNVTMNNGYDFPECYELVLREAQNISWSLDTEKALVVIGDSIPHKPNEYKQIDWNKELDQLVARGIKVYGVQVGDNSANKPFYETLASKSGGQYLTLNNIQSISEIILGLCYREASGLEGLKFEDIDLTKDVPTNLTTEEDAMEVDNSSKADTDIVILAAHEAIHSGSTEATIYDGSTYPVSQGTAGCKMVRIMDTTFVEQNKTADTKFAQLASTGRRITWMVRRGKWGLVVDDKIVKRIC